MKKCDLEAVKLQAINWDHLPGRKQAGVIATATFDDCPECVNHYGERFCRVADSVKYNLRLVEHNSVRCGLFTEIETLQGVDES